MWVMAASLGAAQPENLPAGASALSTVRFMPGAAAFATMPAAPPWQEAGQSQTRTRQPAPSRLMGKRSKGMIVSGLVLIGGGAYMLIANPNLTQQYLLTSNGNLVKQGYHARLIGGGLSGVGGLILWQGLKRR
jgi:hypothetical protein